MGIKMVDYYVKGLSMDARQEIYAALRAVNTSRIEKLLEKPEGYPSYKSMRFSDSDIEWELKNSCAKFEVVNALMIKNARPPLFEDTADVYGCALRYIELMRIYCESENELAMPSLTDFGKRREMAEVLIKKMGCSWEDYVPEIYNKTR